MVGGFSAQDCRVGRLEIDARSNDQAPGIGSSIFENWTETNLQSIDPHLMWEFGGSRDDKEIIAA